MNYLPKSEQKSEFVQKLFNNIASKYDLMNDLMTLGFHRLWKKEIAKSLLRPPALAPPHFMESEINLDCKREQQKD